MIDTSQKFWKASYQNGLPKLYINPPQFSRYCKQLANPDTPVHEERIYTCFDVPGIGKSTLVHTICKQNKFVYLNVPFYTWAGATRFGEYFDALCTYLTEKKLCTCSRIQGILERMCSRMLITIFQQAMKMPHDNEPFIVVASNGMNLPPVEQWMDLYQSDSSQQLLETVNLFKTQVMEQFNAPTTVLFFDDMQLWSVPLHFKKISDRDEQFNAEIPRTEALNYRIIALSRVLASLPPFIKPVIAGTSDLGKRMTIDSGVKAEQLVVHFSTSKAISEIVNFYWYVSLLW